MVISGSYILFLDPSRSILPKRYRHRGALLVQLEKFERCVLFSLLVHIGLTLRRMYPDHLSELAKTVGKGHLGPTYQGVSAFHDVTISASRRA
jgi:hypothetical protein